MPETFYIDSDEEIISVIGKLRKSPSEVNYFVMPKRALIIQSIVNLRLFLREADKLGKKIVLVTQDEIGQNLAKKVGIETEHYSDEFSDRQGHVELSPLASSPESTSQKSANAAALAIPRSESIGSAEFSVGQASALSVTRSAEPIESKSRMNDVQLRVRNAGPTGLTSLNSVRENTSEKKFTPPYLDPSAAIPHSIVRTTPPLPSMTAPSATNPRLEKFFSPNSTERRVRAGTVADRSRPKEKAVPIRQGRSARNIVFVIGALALFSIAGVSAFLFFPKAEIRVTPFQTNRYVNLEFEGSTGNFVSSSERLAVRLIEKEISVALAVETTGNAAGSNQKARGRVTIYNNFNSQPQPLVATTRFESEDGKIFRLVETTTVPGMTGDTAGTIEVAVMADQAGTDYNLSATTFSIPGFKGTSKFNKFSARSMQSMAGGGNGGTDLRAVAQADLDRAQVQAREQAIFDFLTQAQGEIEEGESILKDHAEATPLDSSTPFPPGTLANSFEYQNRFRIRAFVIPEAAIKKEAFTQAAVAVENVRFEPLSAVLSYEGTVPHFDQGQVDLKVRAHMTLESAIDEGALKEKLLGQDEAGIEALLTEFPGINKIEVRFEPRGLVSTIPNRPTRVTIVREAGEE